MQAAIGKTGTRQETYRCGNRKTHRKPVQHAEETDRDPRSLLQQTEEGTKRKATGTNIPPQRMRTQAHERESDQRHGKTLREAPCTATTAATKMTEWQAPILNKVSISLNTTSDFLNKLSEIKTNSVHTDF